MPPRRSWLVFVAALGLAVLVGQAGLGARAADKALAASSGHFQLTPVLAGLNQPTAVAFAPDGRVFIAEKEGRVLAYRSLSDRHPRVIIDVSRRADSYWDRGLLSIALDPAYPKKPYLYLLYSLDAPPGQAPPVWHDTCPNPPGGMKDGCVDTGVLSRVRVSPKGLSAGSEQVLIKDRWCHQFTSHDVGDLTFGPGRALYVSAGEGSNWAGLDYGQYGGSPGSPTAKNPCGDPPGGQGASLLPQTSQGGALRAQDLMSKGDPVSYDGAVIRVSPDTGRALKSDPLYGGQVRADDAIVAFGLRNPYRLAVQPKSGDLYIADVGWNRFEELDILAPGHLANYGWPCYEGSGRQPVYGAAGLGFCNELYSGQRGYTKAPLLGPYYSYRNNFPPYATCDGRGAALSGLAFYEGARYPQGYKGALFFSDYAGRCLYAMLAPNGKPDPKQVALIASKLTPVDLKTGPAGDVYVVDIASGQLLRLEYFKGDRPPLAAVSATPASGKLPLTVTLSAVKTRDLDGGPLHYSWDLNGNGRFGDASGVQVKHTYSKAGNYVVAVKVTDSQGLSAVATTNILAGNTPPQVFIDTPALGYQFKANEYLLYSGHATDSQQGALSPSALTWTFLLHHCVSPGHCHTHYLEQRPGGDGGGLNVPDHGWPNYLEIQLTATDKEGASTTVTRDVYPLPVKLHVASDPAAVNLVVGDQNKAAPFDYTADALGEFPVSAPATATVNGQAYRFQSWSDGGPETHLVKMGSAEQSLTATYIKK